MNYWQIAAGAEGRDYSQFFLKHGMAFVGGTENETLLAQVNAGDRIVLKGGVSEILAVGTVVERNGVCSGNAIGPDNGIKEDKRWLMHLDGWRLPAYSYVEWHEVPKELRRACGLARGTIRRMKKQELRDFADRILSTQAAYSPIEPEPAPTREVKDDDILMFLIRRGLRAGAAEQLSATFNRIRLLARYYYDEELCRWGDVREHETRTFLVVPLLLALGWAEQQMKIELPVSAQRKVDVACFARPYGVEATMNASNKGCVLIVETKGFSSGLDYAREQATAYAEHFPSCKALVVSNGYCYKAFKRGDQGTFPQQPTAYLNLLDARDKYPLDPAHVAGALEVMELLLPGSI